MIWLSQYLLLFLCNPFHWEKFYFSLITFKLEINF